jgi:hypothetical protein
MLSIVSGIWVVVVRTQGDPSFSITPLLLSFGGSEPEAAFKGGFMAITSLSWLLPNGTQLWTGNFGVTPNLQGAIDSGFEKGRFHCRVWRRRCQRGPRFDERAARNDHRYPD